MPITKSCPILNKIDLAGADVEGRAQQIEDVVGIPTLTMPLSANFSKGVP